MKSLHIRLLVIVAILIVARARAMAGDLCEGWLAGPLHAQSQDLEGYVACATVWQPPAGPPLLVIGGEFTSVGGVVCNNLAAWDGASWRAIGGGTDDRVNALATYHGDLIVGGDFTVAGNQQVNGIARWNGTAWFGLYGSQGGPGLFAQDIPELARCDGLTVYQGYLVVVGHFSHAGGVPAQNLALWYDDPRNGTSEWSAIGAGLTHASGSFAAGLAATVHNGVLYLAGRFDRAGTTPAVNVAAWNGAAFSALGTGVTGGLDSATTLCSFGSDLIVGGTFTNAGGIVANQVAAWNGAAWSAMGSGIGAYVWALQSFNGMLFAGSDQSTGIIHRWNGSVWVGYSGFSGSPAPYCNAMTVYNSQMVVAGNFATANGATADSIAQFSGLVTWSALQAPAPQVLCMEQFSNRLVAAGSFLQSTTPQLPAGSGGPARNIIAFDGINLQRLTDGTSDGVNGNVRAMKSFSIPGFRTLLVGGDFTQAGSVPAARIAAYTESNFGPPTWSALGAGLNNSVYAIERFNNTTVAGGTFTASGATSLNHIAAWNGSAWAPLGSGINGTVHALKTFNGFLYAGGDFTTAGGVSTGGLARWNGSTWADVGGFFNGTVYALEVHNGELVIGGLFPGLPGSPNIAKYDGSSYSTLGNGGTNGAVTELRSNGTHIYVAGGFTNAGGSTAKSLARWSISTGWNEVGSGVVEPINALAFFHGELNVGLGALLGFDGLTAPTPGKGWLRYTLSGSPWVAQQPFGQTVECLGQATFSVLAASQLPTAYQWRRNGVPLADGPTGHGSSIQGSTTSNMTISSVRAVDAADYDCVVSNACGSEASFAATLSANCCAADITGDHVVNVSDLLAVINGWGPCPAPPTQDSCLGDVTPAGGDGVVNVSDLLVIVNGWGSCR